MKSNILKSMAVVVTAIFAGYNVYLAQAEKMQCLTLYWQTWKL